MEANPDSKWPGKYFDNESNFWKCRICGQVASRSGGASALTLRQSVRKFHTVARCAKGLLTQRDEVKEKAIHEVQGLGLVYLKQFLDILRPSVSFGKELVILPPKEAPTRARSRSPVLAP